MLSARACLSVIFVCQVSFPLAEPHSSRQSRWWFNLHSTEYSEQAVELVTKHRSSITGVFVYAGLGLNDDGEIDCDNLRASLVKPIVDLNVTVGVALGVSQTAIQGGAALNGAAAAAACAAQHNLTSLMLDYEPSTNLTHAHAQAYAQFIKELVKETHKLGVETTMCISGWGILTEFDLYASTGVDAMMSMASTYSGKNVTSDQGWVSKELAQNVSLPQLAVGVGTMTTDPTTSKWDYEWDEPKLRNHIAWLQDHDVLNVDMWRADIGFLNGTTAEYYYDVLADFLSGVPVNPAEYWCQDGLRDGKYCCAMECGTCGGAGCGDRPGGSANCCDGSFGGRTCTGPADVACICPVSDWPVDLISGQWRAKL